MKEERKRKERRKEEEKRENQRNTIVFQHKSFLKPNLFTQHLENNKFVPMSDFYDKSHWMCVFSTDWTYTLL